MLARIGRVLLIAEEVGNIDAVLVRHTLHILYIHYMNIIKHE